MNPVSGPLPLWLRRGGALALSLAAHAALLVWLLAATLAVTPAPPPPQPAMLELVRLPPPPPPPPPPPRIEPRKTVTPHPLRRPSPPVHQPQEARAIAPAAVAPPAHTFTARQDDWVAAAPMEGSGIGPRHVPPAYADEVKSRIVAKLDYPPGAVFKAPQGFKGDPKILRRQCTIPYEITVDRNGRMISHRLEPCGDSLLDAAAEAALLKAGPFPPPPDLGAEQYVIYGSANFRIQGGAESRFRP